MSLIQALKLDVPIFQAPMAGTSTPQMAIGVSEAGGLGALGLGAATADVARAMMDQVRANTDRAWQANFFTHQEPVRDEAKEVAWLDRLAPVFARFGGKAPERLNSIYASFNVDEAMFAQVLDVAPPVVSFHFGLPGEDRVRALKDRGCVLICTATSLDEARAIKAAGMDAVVAQGFEAGGHRGVFEPGAADARLGMQALVRQLVVDGGLPVIAAGGIMDGRGVRAAFDLGAVAAQMGTAFIGCPESAADGAYRAALFSDAARATVMTPVISGRPARCLGNGFAGLGLDAAAVPAYPVAYDAGKALNSAAKASGDGTFGAQWAGQGAPRARALPVADLMRMLKQEMGPPVTLKGDGVC